MQQFTQVGVAAGRNYLGRCRKTYPIYMKSKDVASNQLDLEFLETECLFEIAEDAATDYVNKKAIEISNGLKNATASADTPTAATYKR